MTTNWENIMQSVEKKVRSIQNLKLTMYQKAIIINCIIHSKLWYVAHIFPLPIRYANKIKRLTFHYLWGKTYEPIKRSTLSLSKHEGGLGVIDIFYKSQSILTSSFIKSYNNEYGLNYLADYYTDIRVAQLLNRSSNPVQVSYIGTSYYREIISIIQKCTHTKGFPEINAKLIYENITPKHKPNIESLYSLYNWKFIWKEASSVFIMLNEREMIYKYLHEILPTKKRLKDIRRIADSTCEYCAQEESNIHFVFQCERYSAVVIWFKNLLERFCGIRNPQLIKLSFFDLPKVNRKCKNATVMLMSSYIVSMWQARKSNMNSSITKKYMKSKFLQKKSQLRYLLGEKMENVLTTEVCSMNWSNL